jgi:hypothetical protein
VEFNEAITKNVEVLEPRARALAQDEISRGHALDQKTTGLIAAALVLVAAGVAFASHLNEVSAGTGARTLWGVLIVVLLVLLLVSLGFATAVMHPPPFRVAIHKDELEKWATPRFLDRDPTRVLGELMQASVSAISEEPFLFLWVPPVSLKLHPVAPHFAAGSSVVIQLVAKASRGPSRSRPRA